MNSEILSYIIVKYADKGIYYNLCQINKEIYIYCINGLKYFTIDNNSFNNKINNASFTDADLINGLKQVSKLKTLTLYIFTNKHKITDTGLINGLKQVPKLKTLTLEFNYKITANGLINSLKQVPKLKTLKIYIVNNEK